MKTILCRCEDITLDDCTAAIAEGYACFEDLKRYLGVGTGPCQGKSCVQTAMRLVADAQDIAIEDVDVMTFRPPVRPVPFAVLAAPDGEGDWQGRTAVHVEQAGDAATGDARAQDADRARGADHGAERGGEDA